MASGPHLRRPDLDESLGEEDRELQHMYRALDCADSYILKSAHKRATQKYGTLNMF